MELCSHCLKAFEFGEGAVKALRKSSEQCYDISTAEPQSSEKSQSSLSNAASVSPASQEPAKVSTSGLIQQQHQQRQQQEEPKEEDEEKPKNDQAREKLNLLDPCPSFSSGPPQVPEHSALHSPGSLCKPDSSASDTVTEGLQGSPVMSPSPKRAKVDASPSPSSLHRHFSPTPTCLSKALCPSCLGILEESFIEELASHLVDNLRQAGYIGVEKYFMAISVPLSLVIRHVGIGLQLEKLLEESELATFHLEENQVKDNFRNRLKLVLMKLLPEVSYDPDAPLKVSVKITHCTSREECAVLAEINPDAFLKVRKQGRRKVKSLDVNLVTVKRALEDMTSEIFDANPNLIPPVCIPPHSPCSYEFDFEHKSLFIAGRYNKYSRTLPQTPWILEGIRKAESSVQELICDKLQRAVSSPDAKLSASGREDVDVRMLGRGRPFLVELLNPKTSKLSDEELLELEKAINSSTSEIAVRQLKIIPKQASALLKQGEEEKIKFYSAVICTSQEITQNDLSFLSEMKDLTIQQKTPIRVLHRRSLSTRERTIHTLQGELLDSHHFKLSLSTQAGTYVKEFVHGDFGRTRPNLGDLLKQEVDILSLDVEDVSLEWPP